MRPKPEQALSSMPGSDVSASSTTPADASGVRIGVVPLRHRFQALRVKEVVRETEDAVSIVLDVPREAADLFAYRAGQFVTLRVDIDGERHLRSYSMSSSPDIDRDLQVTVKRVPGGRVSNWLNDNVVRGATIEVNPPAGTFLLRDTDSEVVAFAAGSGITPVFSIVKAALATTRRRVRLLYANRDLESAIFAQQLGELAARSPERLIVQHHLDCERGFVDPEEVVEFLGEERAGEFYVCGPAPFMSTVESALRSIGIDDGRIHVERFTPETQDVGGLGGGTPEIDAIEVTIELGGRTVTVRHREGFTILQSARWAGLRAPSSCENGVCATCMARVVEGRVEMRHNEALTADEVADGWILTCQAIPVTPVVGVVYE